MANIHAPDPHWATKPPVVAQPKRRTHALTHTHIQEWLKTVEKEVAIVLTRPVHLRYLAQRPYRPDARHHTLTQEKTNYRIPRA